LSLEILNSIIILSVIIEFTNEIIKKAIPAVSGVHSQKTAIIIGVMLCIATESGILTLLGVNLRYPLIDYIISGIILSRGSNVIHDLLSRLERTKPHQ